MTGKRPEISSAVERVQFDLINDSDYRDTWQANVAMAIYDTKQKKGESAHSWRNRCAEQFLKYFCAGHPDDPTSQLMEAVGL